MNQTEILAAFEKVGAMIQNSHLVYTSGRHGTSYVNKDAVYPHTRLTRELCLEMASQWVEEKIDVVLAPALGGIILSQWVAFHLSELCGREILGVYAEKAAEGDAFVVKRGYDRLVADQRVLILEDVLTTGISVKRVVDTVRALRGDIVGVSALCNRGGITPVDLGGIPKLHTLVKIDFDSWEEGQCPLCAKNIPINTSVGKGREFLSNRKG